jgi:hypothetical protein
MVYTFEIKETKESQSLIAHLKTLDYVQQKLNTENVITEKILAKAVKSAEKSASIPWETFKKESKTWKNKITK